MNEKLVLTEKKKLNLRFLYIMGNAYTDLFGTINMNNLRCLHFEQPNLNQDVLSKLDGSEEISIGSIEIEDVDVLNSTPLNTLRYFSIYFPKTIPEDKITETVSHSLELLSITSAPRITKFTDFLHTKERRFELDSLEDYEVTFDANISTYMCILKSMLKEAWGSLIINKNTVTYDKVDLNQLVIINEQVFWSIWDNPINVLHNFENNGDFYLSTDNLRMTVNTNENYVGVFSNTGTISFNSGRPTTYQLVPYSFSNDGDLFFLNGNELTIAATTAKNTKSLVIGNNYFNTLTIGISWQHIFHNSGDIYLSNTEFYLVGTLVGNGCVHIQGASTIVISDPTVNGELPSQVYYMVDPDALLIMKGSQGCNIIVAGFGGGNTIQLDDSFSSVSYDYSEGILSISGLLSGFTFTYTFHIGPGYQLENFQWSHPYMRYDEQTPNSGMPSQCKPAPPVPIAPTSVPSYSSSSVHSSSSIDVVSSSKMSTSSAVPEPTNEESITSSSSENKSSMESQSSISLTTSYVVSSSTGSLTEDSASTSLKKSSIEKFSDASSEIKIPSSLPSPTIYSTEGVTSYSPISSTNDHSSAQPISQKISSFANVSTPYSWSGVSDTSNNSNSIYNSKSTGSVIESISTANENNSNVLATSSSTNQIETSNISPSINITIPSADQCKSSTTATTSVNADGKPITTSESGAKNESADTTTYLFDTTKPKFTRTFTLDDNGITMIQSKVVTPEALSVSDIQTPIPQNTTPRIIIPKINENSGSNKCSSLLLLVISYLFIW